MCTCQPLPWLSLVPCSANSTHTRQGTGPRMLLCGVDCVLGSAPCCAVLTVFQDMPLIIRVSHGIVSACFFLEGLSCQQHSWSQNRPCVPSSEACSYSTLLWFFSGVVWSITTVNSIFIGIAGSVVVMLFIFFMASLEHWQVLPCA